jgi:hypothetical protein
MGRAYQPTHIAHSPVPATPCGPPISPQTVFPQPAAPCRCYNRRRPLLLLHKLPLDAGHGVTSLALTRTAPLCAIGPRTLGGCHTNPHRNFLRLSRPLAVAATASLLVRGQGAPGQGPL